LDQDVPFHIVTERNKTVAELKELIKEKNCIPFADIESTSLDVYHVDIA
jgi:Crinkler effector protein N-terminal domain